MRKADASTDAKDVARTFQKAQSEGKQIWYFTAPASIPIEVIQEHALPLSKIQSGEPIITHNGAEYNATLEEGTTLHSIQVLLPTETGDKYELMKQPIAQALHIKRVTRLNPAVAAAAAATTAPVLTSAPAPSDVTSFVNVPRPQPTGLKARFYPIGALPGASSTSKTDEHAAAAAADSDVDMAEASAPAAKTSSKKRKGSSEATEDAAAPAKKTKKTKEPKEAKEPKDSKTSSSKKAAAKSETPIAPPAVPGAAAKKTAVTPKKVTPILPPTIPGSSKSKSS